MVGGDGFVTMVGCGGGFVTVVGCGGVGCGRGGSEYLKRKGVRSPSVQKDRDHPREGYDGLMIANPEFLLRFFSLHHLRRPKFFLYHSLSRFSFSFCSVDLFCVFMLFFFFLISGFGIF